MAMKRPNRDAVPTVLMHPDPMVLILEDPAFGVSLVLHKLVITSTKDTITNKTVPMNAAVWMGAIRTVTARGKLTIPTMICTKAK